MTEEKADTVRIIDWDEALRLANNNHDLAKEMLHLLAERLPEDRNDILAAFKNQNYPKLKQLSHKLRGALCYCGVPRLRAVVETLDNELKLPADAKVLNALMLDLNHEIDLLLDVVKNSP